MSDPELDPDLDRHGERQLDPEPGSAAGARRHADELADHDERAADETRGAITQVRPDERHDD